MKQAFHSIKFKMKIKKILILSSHLKRSSLLWVDNNSRLLQQKTIKKGNILAFHWCLFETEHYMAAWRYEISLLVLKNISLVSRSHLVSSMYNLKTLLVSKPYKSRRGCFSVHEPMNAAGVFLTGYQS